MDGVSILKDSNSLYWSSYTEKGSHAEPNHPETIVVSNGGFSNILERLMAIIPEMQNQSVKEDLEKACELLRKGINNHDISKLFEAHEIIHDYDYWVINTPLELEIAPPDWEGVHVYFGKVSIM